MNDNLVLSARNPEPPPLPRQIEAIRQAIVATGSYDQNVIAGAAGVDTYIVSRVLKEDPEALVLLQHAVQKRYDVIIAALRKYDGILAPAARELGLERQSLSRIVHGSPYLMEIQAECKEALADDVELVAYAKAREGTRWAVVKILESTIGQQRGWRDTTNIVHLQLSTHLDLE